jgi:hypothetical protein
MMEVGLACIVEGHGECEAAPVLVRRIAARLDPALLIRIPPPLRVPKSRLLKPGELERTVELAARKVGRAGAILILLDSDEDCPAEWGPMILQRAVAARGDLPVGVVLAKREFEAWFLAAAESLQGTRGLRGDLESPCDPEGIRGAKEWLSERMEGNRHYVETLDQPALAARFSIEEARRSASFDKCYREVVHLITARI